ncbi:MAG: hypothetical protein ACYCSW_05215 [bacterium]
MKLSNFILSAIKELNTKDIFVGKTVIQKIVFFSLPEEQDIFKPYLYGPYSEDVQVTFRGLQFCNKIKYDEHKGYTIADSEQIEILPSVKKVVNFLYNKEIKERDDIANFSKIYYFYKKNIAKTGDKIEKIIKNNGPFIWHSLSKLTEAEISKFLQYSKELYKILNPEHLCKT